MAKKRSTISANEMNKYAYCPYQWYYEKLYGATELKRQKKEYNTMMGRKDTVFSNLRFGKSFHKTYDLKLKMRQALIRVAIVTLVAICIILFLVIKYG